MHFVFNCFTSCQSDLITRSVYIFFSFAWPVITSCIFCMDSTKCKEKMLQVLINSKSYKCLVLVAKTFNFLLAVYCL